MKYHIIIRKKAEEQLADAFAWYEEKRIGLGENFLFSINVALFAIEKNPNLFQKRHKNIRCALTQKFPFGIFYFVTENRIIIISIFHLSKNPKFWKK